MFNFTWRDVGVFVVILLVVAACFAALVGLAVLIRGVEAAEPTLAWSDFLTQTQGIDDPYELISWLDGRPEKVDNPVGGYEVVTGPGEAVVLWTGLYVNDVTLGGAVVPYLVDGKTGTWIVLPNQSVVIPTPGGTIEITAGEFGGGQVAEALDSCVETSGVLAVINNNKIIDPNWIYIRLDEIANENPEARLRGRVSTAYKVLNTQALFWVRTGQIEGSIQELDETEAKSLYLVTATGTVTVTYPHSGLHLCSDINPVRDFPWWGKP